MPEVSGKTTVDDIEVTPSPVQEDNDTTSSTPKEPVNYDDLDDLIDDMK